MNRSKLYFSLLFEVNTFQNVNKIVKSKNKIYRKIYEFHKNNMEDEICPKKILL